MKFIYHKVPKNLKGKTLYPLGELKDKFPHLYNDEIKKYQDHPKRKLLPEKIIPHLNCRRSDVLHCSPIDPRLVFNAYSTVFPDAKHSLKFFKIPMEGLVDIQKCFFNMNHPDYEFGLETDPPAAFELIESNTYQELDKVPDEAYSFFKEWKAQGEKDAPIWGKIPHVFVKGAIHLENLEIIDWVS